jgi:hypothetical protein
MKTNFNDVFEIFDKFFTEINYSGGYTRLTTPEGNVEVYKNGRLHNEYGPAVVYKDGKKEFWLNGRQVCESDVIKTKKYTVELTDEEFKAISTYLKGRKIEEVK